MPIFPELMGSIGNSFSAFLICWAHQRSQQDNNAGIKIEEMDGFHTLSENQISLNCFTLYIKKKIKSEAKQIISPLKVLIMTFTHPV